MDNFQGPDLEITNTTSFSDMLQIEWGPDLGKALCLRFPYVRVYDGWSSILASSGGEVEVLISLETKSLRRMRADKEWAAFATEYD
jgi:hypothetical protein